MKAFLILDLSYLFILALSEILLQMGMTKMFTIMYKASSFRLICLAVLTIPYTIHCIILRWCIGCIFKDGTILRKFRCWKLSRTIVVGIGIATTVTGRMFLFIALFSYDFSNFQITTGYSEKWLIIDHTIEIFRIIIGIYILFGFKTITLALSRLKRSDEFDGEYYSDNESKSDKVSKKNVEKEKENQKMYEEA